MEDGCQLNLGGGVGGSAGLKGGGGRGEGVQERVHNLFHVWSVPGGTKNLKQTSANPSSFEHLRIEHKK